MITLNMMLLPYGSGIGRTGILSGTIYTTDDGKQHAYRLTLDANGTTVEGAFDKEFSGHKNPLELLEKVLGDINARTKRKRIS